MMKLSCLLAVVLTHASLNVYCVNAGIAVPPAKCFSKLDIVFVLDMSGSIGKANFEKMKESVISICNTYTIGSNAVQVGVDVFNNRAVTKIRLNQHNNINSLISAIKKIRYRGGGTKTYLALLNLLCKSFTRRYGDRSNAPNLAIIMTDGNSDDKEKTLAAAKLVRMFGISISVIPIGENIDMSEITGMTGGTSGLVIPALNFNTLLTKAFQQKVSSLKCSAAIG